MVPAMTRSLSSIAALALLIAGGCKKDDKTSAKPDPKPETTRPQAAADAAAAPQQSEPQQSKIETEEVSYKAGDTELKGFLALPAGASAENKVPGVLVVHEWWGHNQYVRDRARMLAELGYAALAVDMYGDGKNTEHPADAQKFAQEVMSNQEVGTARFEAARELLASRPEVAGDKLAAVGYCFGGSVVLHAARAGADLDAVAAFHPGGFAAETPVEKGEVDAKILVATGGADPFVKPESVAAFKKEMKESGVDLRYVEYPGAKHAFTNPEATELGKKHSMPLAYDAEADKKSWTELRQLLDDVWPG